MPDDGGYYEFELEMRAVEVASERQWSGMTEAEWHELVEAAQRELREADERV